MIAVDRDDFFLRADRFGKTAVVILPQ